METPANPVSEKVLDPALAAGTKVSQLHLTVYEDAKAHDAEGEIEGVRCIRVRMRHNDQQAIAESPLYSTQGEKSAATEFLFQCLPWLISERLWPHLTPKYKRNDDGSYSPVPDNEQPEAFLQRP